MASLDNAISTLLLPMNGFFSILPQAAIVEVAQRPAVDEVKNSADWLSGMFDWREERVPLLSFEKLCGRPAAAQESNSRVVVLYALEEFRGLVYYALDLYAIPHPAALQVDMIADANEDLISGQYVARNVEIGGHPGVIPDLKQIEYSIQAELKHLQ